MPYRTKNLSKLIKSVVKESFITIKVLDYNIAEDLHEEKTSLKINFQVHMVADKHNNEQIYTCESEGHGFVDALFHGLMKCIQNLKLSKFPVVFEPRVESFVVKSETESVKDDIFCTLAICSKDGRSEPFVFEAGGFSINAASLAVTIKAIEFFVNAHQTFCAVQLALKDAKRRSRIDLVEINTERLVDLVQVADYSTINEKEH